MPNLEAVRLNHIQYCYVIYAIKTISTYNYAFSFAISFALNNATIYFTVQVIM